MSSTPSRQKRIAVWERDLRSCHYCLKTLPFGDVTMDHVVPKAFGGPPTFWNFVAACITCNSKWANAVRKCECGVCSASLERFLKERHLHKPMPPEFLRAPHPGTLKPRRRVTRAIADVIDELEARHASLIETIAVLPDSDHTTHHAAAMRGKAVGLREALALLDTVDDSEAREAC